MSRRLIIFGTGDFAELAAFYFRHDSEYALEAFTVDGQFLSESSFSGLPVIPCEELQKGPFSQREVDVYVAIGYSALNENRAKKLEWFESIGYRPASYVSTKATYYPGLNHGKHCFIFENNTIQPFVTIGDNVVCWSGNHIGHHSSIGSHTFITSHVVIAGRVSIGEYSFLGGNCMISDHVSIGSRNIIGSGAMVTRDTDDGQVITAPPSMVRKVPPHRVKI